MAISFDASSPWLLNTILCQKSRLGLIASACILVCLVVIASSLIRMWYRILASLLDEDLWGRTRRSFRTSKLRLVTLCVGIVISAVTLGMCLVLEAPIHISLLVRNFFSILLSCFSNHSQGQAIVAMIVLGSALLSDTSNHDQDQRLKKILDLDQIEKYDLQNEPTIKTYCLQLRESQVEQPPLYSETTPRLGGQMIKTDNQQSSFDNVQTKDDTKGLNSVPDRNPRNTLYACTFSGCFEKFENKYTWKRHENSGHFQHECWICTFCPRKDKDGNGQMQTRLFYTRYLYVKHLQSVHSADYNTVKQQTHNQRNGRNNRSQFWCGFCGEIVQLRMKGLEGAEERFDHIERHFVHGERIANYMEMDGDVKGNGNTMEPEGAVGESLMSRNDENSRVPDLYD